jgi:hypothetical protein
MVTDENFGELLIEGLEQALAHRRGELEDSRIIKRFAPPWRVESPDDDDLDDNDSDDIPPEHGPRNRLRP